MPKFLYLEPIPHAGKQDALLDALRETQPSLSEVESSTYTYGNTGPVWKHFHPKLMVTEANATFQVEDVNEVRVGYSQARLAAVVRIESQWYAASTSAHRKTVDAPEFMPSAQP